MKNSGQFTKGQVPWNKGLLGYRAREKSHLWKGGKHLAICLTCWRDFFYWKGNSRGLYCSKWCSNIANAKDKENNPAWKGGVSTNVQIARGSPELKRWRKKVFKRDNYTCQKCNKRGCELNAHHIIPFSKQLDLRHNLKNGTTLCVTCHKKTDNYGYKGISI